MRNLFFIQLLIVGMVSASSVARSRVKHANLNSRLESREVLVIIDNRDTITAGDFERSLIKNRVGKAEGMSTAEFFDDYLTFRLNIADAKLAQVDELPEYRLAVAAHTISLIQPELQPHLADMITVQNEDAASVVIAAVDSVYNTRSDIREAIGEFEDFMLSDYVVEAYLEKEGLNNSDSLELFFEETRDDYIWDKPRFKGYIICVARAENSDEAEAIITKTDGDMDKAIPLLRSTYGRNIMIGHVVMEQGTNDIVDYVAFGGVRTGNVDNWSLCRAIDGRIIDAPESFEDVRGTVTDKFRKKLLERRYRLLRTAHNVKINQNALKKIESLTGDGDETSSAQNK